MSPTHPSLLVVDDDEDTCLNLADIFTDLGYRVETCLDGPKAVERVRKGCFDVFLLDLMLPGMDGLALFQRLHELCPQTEAVLITGEPHHARATESLQSGMNCMIPKPLDVASLATVVAKIVRECERLDSTYRI